MRTIKVTLLVVSLLCLFILVASAKDKQPTASKDKASTEQADDEPEAADAGAGASAEAPPTDDLGEAPPKAAPEPGEGKRLSPLNPEPEEFPDAGVKPPPAAYDQLLGDIAALRSRVAALTTTLFASKLRVIVEAEESPARIRSFNVTLDEGVIYSADKRFTAEDERIIYEHAVAPGHHVLGVEVERRDSRGKQFETWQGTKFSVVVPEGKQLEALVRLSDDSDMAEDFPSDEDGEYDMRVRLRARVVE